MKEIAAQEATSSLSSDFIFCHAPSLPERVAMLKTRARGHLPLQRQAFSAPPPLALPGAYDDQIFDWRVMLSYRRDGRYRDYAHRLLAQTADSGHDIEAHYTDV